MLKNLFTSIGVGILAVLWPLAACAQGERTRASLCFSANDWAGKYPDDKSAVYGRFLDLPCVQANLQALLPQAEYRSLRTQFRVDSPIELIGRFLIVARCEAHNCPAHHAMIIVDSESADIIVGLYRRGSASSRTTWYSTRIDPLQLPQEVLGHFLLRHAPK